MMCHIQCTGIAALASILNELLALDGFNCNFMSARAENFHDNSQLCTTGHDDNVTFKQELQEDNIALLLGA